MGLNCNHIRQLCRFSSSIGDALVRTRRRIQTKAKVFVEWVYCQFAYKSLAHTYTQYTTGPLCIVALQISPQQHNSTSISAQAIGSRLLVVWGHFPPLFISFGILFSLFGVSVAAAAALCAQRGDCGTHFPFYAAFTYAWNNNALAYSANLWIFTFSHLWAGAPLFRALSILAKEILVASHQRRTSSSSRWECPTWRLRGCSSSSMDHLLGEKYGKASFLLTIFSYNTILIYIRRQTSQQLNHIVDVKDQSH